MGHPESSCRLADFRLARVNTNFKSSGQECPHHTINTNIKGDGQECPSCIYRQIRFMAVL
jgi:hypothetical protein